METRAKWLAASAALALLAGPASAGTGHQWGDFRWDTGGSKGENALSLNISYSFADESYWLPYYVNATTGSLIGAIRKWDSPSGYTSPLALTDKGNATHTTPLACESIVGEVLVCAERYGTTGWLGVAEIEYDPATNYILWATAKFNDSYYREPPYSSTYDNDEQRQFLACHEIGHTFGLGHLDTNFYNPNKGSCMDYTADPDGGARGKDNRHPGSVDWDVLLSSTMYGTGTSGGGGGGGGKGGGKPARLDPFQFREVGGPAPQGAANGRFGQIVAFDSEGRPVEFIRELRNGNKLVIFVTWAKGYRPEGSR